MVSKSDYVHGYTQRENQRLVDQATALTELLHHDTRYPAGSTVLEVGCGVGAQTVILSKNSPEARFTSIDISLESLMRAKELIASRGMGNVDFAREDLYDLHYVDEYFDHIFVCFLLEHLAQPVRALQCLKSKLRHGGSITVIEGDHESAYFYPRSGHAWKTIQCLIDVQAQIGGDALIGRRLFPLINEAGFRDVVVSPRMVYADASRPEMVQGFTRETFIAMVAGVEDEAIRNGMIDAETWQQGILDLERTTAEDGTFCYTFFKALAFK